MGQFAQGELDRVMKEVGDVPTLQQMFQLASDKGWNANNTRIEYYQWRRFHGYGAVVVSHEERRKADRRVKAVKIGRRKEQRHAERRMAA